MTALIATWLVVATGFTLVTLFRLRSRRLSTPLTGLAEALSRPFIPSEVEGRSSPPQRARSGPSTPLGVNGHLLPDSRNPHGIERVLLLRPLDEPTPREVQNLSAPLPEGVRQVVLAPFRPPTSVRGEWLPSDPPCGNRKAGHLAYALAVVPLEGELVVCADADVRVTRELLDAVASPVRDGAELCTAAPVPEDALDAAGHALRGLLWRTHHAFAALGVMTVGAPAVCGKAMALGPHAIDELPRLTHCIGEDLELARRLHLRGKRVELASVSAHTPATPQTLRSAVQRITRWMQVLRAHRPALYPSVPLLFAPTVPLLVLAGLSQQPALLAGVAVLVLTRVALSVRLSGPSGAALWEWLGGEVLLLASFVRSLFKRRVTWRGRRLEVRPGGLIKVVT